MLSGQPNVDRCSACRCEARLPAPGDATLLWSHKAAALCPRSSVGRFRRGSVPGTGEGNQAAVTSE